MIGSFAEIPRLEWKETITMIERNAGTWWRYDGDQYARNPSRQTFTTWTNRYLYTYYSVREGSYGADATNCLYDGTGARLARDAFPRLNSDREKADAVRNYLKSFGGIMEVTVVDKPGINKPQVGAVVHKNRILTFDCGLHGAGFRVAAVQHLTVDSTVIEGQWVRDCKLGGVSRPFSTTGLRKVDPPADVTIVKRTSARMGGVYKVSGVGK